MSINYRNYRSPSLVQPKENKQANQTKNLAFKNTTEEKRANVPPTCKNPKESRRMIEDFNIIRSQIKKDTNSAGISAETAITETPPIQNNIIQKEEITTENIRGKQAPGVGKAERIKAETTNLQDAITRFHETLIDENKQIGFNCLTITVPVYTYQTIPDLKEYLNSNLQETGRYEFLGRQTANRKAIIGYNIYGLEPDQGKKIIKDLEKSKKFPDLKIEKVLGLNPKRVPENERPRKYLTLSIHAHNNEPAKKLKSLLDIKLPETSTFEVRRKWTDSDKAFYKYNIYGLTKNQELEIIKDLKKYNDFSDLIVRRVSSLKSQKVSGVGPEIVFENEKPNRYLTLSINTTRNGHVNRLLSFLDQKLPKTAIFEENSPEKNREKGLYTLNIYGLTEDEENEIVEKLEKLKFFSDLIAKRISKENANGQYEYKITDLS